MNKSDFIRIHFCFPPLSVDNNGAFARFVIKNIPLDEEIGYAGYSHQKYFRAYLEGKYKDTNIKKYQIITYEKKQEIEKIIFSTLSDCFKILSPASPVHVFVFPLLEPYDEVDRMLGYVHGYCPYQNTIHIFLNYQEASEYSVKSTVSHEYSHAIFYNYHKNEQTLFDCFIFEGLAQNFEQEITKRIPTPYANALSKKMAIDIFKNFDEDELNSKEYILYQNVFFGDKKYKKWTGYTIGYWLVWLFRSKHKKLSWEHIMKLDSNKFIDESE